MEVKERLSCRPKHPTSCQKSADQYCTPVKKFQAWLRIFSTEAKASDRTDRNRDGDQEQQQHHPLPDSTKRIANNRLACLGEVLGQRQIDGGDHQEDQQWSSTHPERGLFPPGARRCWNFRHRFKNDGFFGADLGADGRTLVVPAGNIDGG